MNNNLQLPYSLQRNLSTAKQFNTLEQVKINQLKPINVSQRWLNKEILEKQIEDNSITQPIPRVCKKIIIMDQENTCKTSKIIKTELNSKNQKLTKIIHNNQKQQAKANNKIQQKDNNLNEKFQLEVNKKVQVILSRNTLRERTAHLLPKHYRLTLGFSHRYLLRVLDCIDCTMQYLSSNRQINHIFWDKLKNNIRESVKMNIHLSDLQRILFLQDKLYELLWQKNTVTHKMAIIVKMGNININRKEILLQKLIEYLQMKEKQFLIKNGYIKTNHNNWHIEFNLEQQCIPISALPIHPQIKPIQIQALAEKQIMSCKNTLLKSLLQSKKDDYQSKSISSDAASVLLKGGNKKQLVQQLYSKIREKEIKMKEIVKDANNNQTIMNKIDKGMMCRLIDDIMMAFMSRRVSNLFQMTLIDLLQPKVSLKSSEIQLYIEQILKQKEIGFLQLILLTNKTQVIQINKSKFNSIIQYFQKQESKQKLIAK